jgi:cellulose synthase/poly-beta-1,6-N-acetylglucosamine synthase-like glycosyltransferase
MNNPLVFIPVAILYLIVVSSLYVYGINFYYLSFMAIRQRRRIPPSPQLNGKPRPFVTVQLPIYNEMYVSRRLIESAAKMDYPRDRIEFQVLDDSVDETRQIVAEIVAELRSAGVDIHHIHRADREGFKAGALKNGMGLAKGEYLAIFDADFTPTEDFLDRTIPHFEDPQIAFVQGRWGHLNANYSLLTYIQSLSIDAHFMVEQFSRYTGGYFFNFNGTAGIWRKSAIEDAGGWQPHTLTEDLDLSYRTFLKGWRAHYLRDLVIPAELPVTFSAFRRQQHRWARGSLENAAILMPKVWSSDLPLRVKLQSALHLTGYAVHLLMFVLSLIYPLVITLSMDYPGLVSLFGITLAFNLTALAPTMFFIVAQAELSRDWWRKLPVILFVSVFGSGMMINTLRAAWQAITGKLNVFERTPKLGITHRGQPWRAFGYQLALDGIVFLEILFAALNLFTTYMAIQAGHFFIAFYAMMFAAGLLFTSFYSIGQSFYAARQK